MLLKRQPPLAHIFDVRKISFLLLLSLFFEGCNSRTTFRFDDPNEITIAEFQDRGLSDSLYRFLKSPNARYRASSALAFASLKDTMASPALGTLLLEDADTTVRINAAFALGQTGGIASVNSLIPAVQDKDKVVVREVLQSLGKTLQKGDVDVLRKYEPIDSITQEGYAWAMYRLGTRGLADSIFIEKEIEFLNPRYSRMTRIGAANFFGRSSLKGTRFESAIIKSALIDPLSEVRMIAASGLKKLNSDAAFEAIEKILKSEKDYRTRINATRSLVAFDPEKAKPLFLLMLRDSSINVGIAASEAVGSTLKIAWPELVEIARTSNWRIQANLYKAILKIDTSKRIMDEVKKTFNASSNNYQKAWLLGAIAMDPNEYLFISNMLLRSEIFVIKSSAAEALVAINRQKNFPASLKQPMADVYKSAILNGDPAVVGIICGALTDTTLAYKKQFKDIKFLHEAKGKMKLPKDIESQQPLDEAIAYFEGKGKISPLKNNWNHPIDWKIVKSVVGHERIIIKTTKGEIILRLLPSDSPGSVANFADLMSKHYFDEKFFHRTVPNFVIQTGCNRGDGSGSEDYSIRSEFTRRHFTTGAVGMASAGKDTEGTQWFITHSATPHLDGRYTVFAYVEKGMDVADRIEVGDKIISVIAN